jgi:serine/threonine protein phosphatase PrpC
VATVTGPSATTATVVVVCRRPADGARLVAVIANLGDSRVQLMHGGRLQTVTLDHSYLSEPDLMQAKARQDRLDSAPHLTTLQDPVDRAAFAHRHLLANAITGGGLQDVRHYLVDLLPGDRLVLDSDGVHDNLTTAELEAALAGSASAPEAAEVAVAQAWRRSEEEPDDLGRAKPDDMTMLVLDVREMDVRQSATGTYRLPPGGAVSLSLSPPTKQYLVSAADLQVLVAQRDGQWWATQPGAAPGEAGSWQLQAGHPVEFGRYEPGGFRTEPSERVSRRHMALQLSEGSELLVVSDLNSTNGTAVLGW